MGLVCILAVAVRAAPVHAAAPAINGSWPAGVGETFADLKAKINPGGKATTYRFEYIDDAAYRANGPDRFLGAKNLPPGAEALGGAGSADAVRTQNLEGLTRETTYHFRAVARNGDGTTVGPERTLTTRGAGGSLVLLDNRGWEMVSPVDKNGGEVQGPGSSTGEGLAQAAAAGGSVAFSSISSFAGGAVGAPAASQYLAQRGSSAWTVDNISPPLSSGGYPEAAESPFRLFSADLSRGLFAAPSFPPLSASAPGGYANYYLRGPAGSPTALLTYADIGTLAVPPSAFELDLAGASSDLGHVVLSTCAALTPAATEVPGTGDGCDPTETNLYEWAGGGLRLINIVPPNSTGTPGAGLAAPAASVSHDGSRIFWTDGKGIYLWEGGATSVPVDGPGGGGTFQTASADGSIAFFTRETHLFRYDAIAKTTTDLTPAGGVAGVLGASADGSYAYFLSGEGLFLNHAGSNRKIAAAADPSNFPPSTGTARVSEDGTHLAFVSSGKLTAYENTNPDSGVALSEIYLYEAGADTVTCVSCDPSGAPPTASITLPGARAGAGSGQAYKPRALSADGTRVFFETTESIVPHGTKGRMDVYEWEAGGSGTCGRPAGCLQLISAGRSGSSFFVDANSSGSDVFFLTDNSLVDADPGSVDLYDARENGGFPEPSTTIVCEEDSCQPLPSPPDDPAPGTLVPSTGNPPVRFHGGQRKKHHRKKHHRGRRTRR